MCTHVLQIYPREVRVRIGQSSEGPALELLDSVASRARQRLDPHRAASGPAVLPLRERRAETPVALSEGRRAARITSPGSRGAAAPSPAAPSGPGRGKQLQGLRDSVGRKQKHSQDLRRVHQIPRTTYHMSSASAMSPPFVSGVGTLLRFRGLARRILPRQHGGGLARKPI